ncbi:MAG: hypothetical protein ACI849_000488 [Patiriisocius sp.]|jgi:hypothetical protein
MKNALFSILAVLFVSRTVVSQELALVKDNNKYGYINKSGEFVISPQFENEKSFSEGFTAALEDGNWGFIDASGAWVIEAKYKKI